ncbi:protein translocase subunit SecD [Dehalococcoidales bacterium]|nr:protein translocase subunit SecD [Dehalococcoidales bacterium]
MAKKNIVALIIILVLFAFALSALIYPLLGREAMRLGLDLYGGTRLVYQADLAGVEPGKEIERIEGSMAVIERRIDALGVAEPIIQRLGKDRILVELPGVVEAEEAKRLIGLVALLEFRELVEGEWVPATAIVDGEEKVLTSAYFKEDTRVEPDLLGAPLLIFEWNEVGSKLSEEITGRLIGKPLAIFLGDEPLLGKEGQPIAPIVRTIITDRGQIEGLSWDEARELSRLLNAGRIPIPLTAIYEYSVSPILGAGFVEMSVKAGIIGIIVVMLFMMVYYRVPGVLACLALIFYGTLVLALFKLIPVTLTLAGLAGFVLSIGMAVDANVLIFERIKEELRTGRTLGAAIENGFNRAWSAIRLSNVTTFIVCGILFWLGSELVGGAPVKGFALTLFIGVAVSMFTAIVVTRTLLRLFVGTPLAQRTWLFSPYLGGK